MINRLISNLPFAIILWWVFLLIVHSSSFYADNYQDINNIDVPFLFISSIHFIFKSKYYSLKKVIFVIGIFFVLQLQLISYDLDDELYYPIYATILITTMVAPLFITNAGKRKRN